MKRLLSLTVILVFFIFLPSIAEEITIYKLKKEKINVNGRDLTVLVAKTEREREIGLSNTELTTLTRLGVDGMLFIFNDSSEKTFQAWHMRYDLMLLVLEKRGKNKFVVKERKPLRIGTIERVSGRYVLEIPLKNTLTEGR